MAYGAGFANGWVDLLFKQISTQFMFSGTTQAETIKSFEKATGLDVPGDLEALGGDGVSVAAGSDLSFDSIYTDPADEPSPHASTGDADHIEAALDKLRTRISDVAGRSCCRDASVTMMFMVSMNASYLKDLEEAGDLGDSDAFRKVLPDAGQVAATVFFMNFRRRQLARRNRPPAATRGTPSLSTPWDVR